jgi:hypothetical protein
MRIVFIFLLTVSVAAKAQWKDYIIGVRGDTLNRADMKGLKQGPWVIHMDEVRGERGYEEEGYYLDDKRDGIWKRYSLEGIKIAEENYRWGKLDGRQKYFTYNGGLLREESWRAIDPAKGFDTVGVTDPLDPTKIKEWVVVKNDGFSVKHGKWNYYDPEWGTVLKSEKYFMNKLQLDDGSMTDDDEIRPIGFDKNKPISDSAAAAKSKLKPQAVLDYEKKNAGKKKVKTRDGETGYKPEP